MRIVPGKAGAIAAALSVVVSVATPTVVFYEGLSTKAYLDPVGIPTICYGETENVAMGQTKTVAECDKLLNLKLGYFALRAYWMLDVPVSDKRLAALTSFAYNVGLGNLKSSTLLRKINAGDPNACAELHRWVYAKGIKLNGLVKRREAEYQLCLQ